MPKYYQQRLIRMRLGKTNEKTTYIIKKMRNKTGIVICINLLPMSVVNTKTLITIRKS